MTNGLRSVTDLDEMDLAILERVEADFDVSLKTLAAEFDILKLTVHYRVNKPKEGGVIRSITTDVGPRSLGLKIVAITNVSATHEAGYSDEIGAEPNALIGVEQVYYTMGDIDFVITSRVQPREQLNVLIDRMVAIDDVDETSPKFVMQEFENDRRCVSNLNEEAHAAVINPLNDVDG